MKRRRVWLCAAVLLGAAAPSCGAPSERVPSEVDSLRILAVAVDHSYAKPGAPLAFRMTFADALGGAGANPRAIQVSWLGGCVNPPGGTFAACYPALASVLAGGAGAALLKQEVLAPELSGVPDAAAFELQLPEGMLEGAVPGTPAVAYVFFTVCAGTVRPHADPRPGDFPLECVDASGKVLGHDSFVAGYTQVYAFADGRDNANPTVTGLSFQGAPIDEDETKAPTAARCVEPVDEAARQGCGRPEEGGGCETYDIEAIVGDVAEADPGSSSADGKPLREVVWVDYFATAGEFDGETKLVSNAETGYRPKHATTWTPPAEAGTVTLWAVVHDARGGASVTRRFVRVE